jgi:hypothetical protein
VERNYWWLKIKSLGFIPTIFMSIKKQEENYGPNLFLLVAHKGLEDINNLIQIIEKNL